jgi:dolichol-phosphate mannosyltransferase
MKRFIKFAAVGGSGVLVNNVVLYVLHGLFGVSLVASSVVAVEAAIVNNFLWNDRWTFGRLCPSLRRFLKFNLVSLGGLVINVVTLTLLVQWTGLPYLAANLAGITAATAWNFSIHYYWTWNAAQTSSEMSSMKASTTTGSKW